MNLRALAAGRHAYVEKPFELTHREAQSVIDAASAAGRLTGSAPDTFLGAGLQTCRKLLDDGAIGAPTAAVAFMASAGSESWHPRTHFYYENGANLPMSRAFSPAQPRPRDWFVAGRLSGRFAPPTQR